VSVKTEVKNLNPERSNDLHSVIYPKMGHNS